MPRTLINNTSYGAFVLLLLFSVASADTLVSSETSEEDNCAIDGWGDFYGPGVRIDLVWLSSWLANNFLDEEIVSTLETNSIFLLALFASVLTLSVQHEAIRVIDVILVHQLCTGFLFSVMSLWGYRTMYYKTEGPGGRRHFGHIGTHFRLVLMSMVTGYGVWFWAIGVKNGLSQIDRREACGGLDTFFFVPLKVDDESTRIPQLVLSTLYVVYYGSMTVVAVIGLSYYSIRRFRRDKITWQLIEGANSETDLTKRELTKWYMIVSAFNLFWIIFSMTCIENTLRLNHMQNIIWFQDTSPGQIIPLLIGIISFGRISYVILRNKFHGTKDKTENGAGGSGYANITQMQDLGPTMTKTKSNFYAAPGSQSTGKRHLTHRLFLAWFPWLQLFNFFRHPIDVIPYYSRDTPTPGFEARYEAMKAPTSQMQSIETEEHDAALLADSPQLQPNQKGLMAASARTSQEVTEREEGGIMDRSRSYDREDYDSDNY